MRAIRSKLTYSNVIASIAMFLALTGGTVMAAKLGSSDLAANSVKKKQLAKNSVTSQDLAKKSLITKSATGGGQLVNVTAVAPATGFPLPLNGPDHIHAQEGLRGPADGRGKGDAGRQLRRRLEFRIRRRSWSTANRGWHCLRDRPARSARPSRLGRRSRTSVRGCGSDRPHWRHQKITAQYNGDSTDCSPTSKLDQVRVVVQQTR